MLINPNKKYSKLVTVGCSYTNGFLKGKEAQWGEYLASHLGCEHIVLGTNASSNYFSYNKILNYCERETDNNFCVGIQLSELSRREIWLESIDDYKAFNLSTIQLGNTDIEELKFIKEHISFFSKVFFNENDMVWRTILSIISVVSYLREKGIDFIIFEGIGSIMDLDTSNYNFPIDTQSKNNLFEYPEFFNRYIDLDNHMKTHELFNQDNGGHPNSEYIQWWSSEMYDYMLEYYNSTNRTPQ